MAEGGAGAWPARGRNPQARSVRIEIDFPTRRIGDCELRPPVECPGTAEFGRPGKRRGGTPVGASRRRQQCRVPGPEKVTRLVSVFAPRQSPNFGFNGALPVIRLGMIGEELKTLISSGSELFEEPRHLDRVISSFRHQVRTEQRSEEHTSELQSRFD